MTVSLAGWRKVVVDGGVMLLPPDPTIGFIRVRHREPLRPLRAVVEGYARLPLGGRPVQLLGPPRALTTDEGEYAAIVKLGTGPGERELRRTLGVVFGDDAVSTIDGRVAKADQFELFDEVVARLTQSLSLGLGVERWRRFYYRPPPGWDGLERFRADVWLTPGFPRSHGVITVFHARPEQDTRAQAQHRKLFEELTVEYGGGRRGEPHAVQTASGMVGQAVTFEAILGGEPRSAGNVAFSDGRYMYFLRLETDAPGKEAHTNAFLQLVRSIEAVPWPHEDLAALIHWSD